MSKAMLKETHAFMQGFLRWHGILIFHGPVAQSDRASGFGETFLIKSFIKKQSKDMQLKKQLPLALLQIRRRYREVEGSNPFGPAFYFSISVIYHRN